jgi:hypothetical protein
MDEKEEWNRSCGDLLFAKDRHESGGPVCEKLNRPVNGLGGNTADKRSEAGGQTDNRLSTIAGG